MICPHTTATHIVHHHEGSEALAKNDWMKESLKKRSRIQDEEMKGENIDGEIERYRDERLFDFLCFLYSFFVRNL